MEIISYIFAPGIFFSLLGIIAVISFVIIFSFARQSADYHKLHEALKKESSLNDELTKKINVLEENLAKVNNELVLRNQVYDGLVGQYNELERDSERLGLEIDELRKNKPKEKSDKLKEIIIPEKTPLVTQTPPKNNTLP